MIPRFIAEASKFLSIENRGPLQLVGDSMGDAGRLGPTENASILVGLLREPEDLCEVLLHALCSFGRAHSPHDFLVEMSTGPSVLIWPA